MIGALWAINAACVIALQVPAVGLIDRIGTRAALVLAPLLYATAFLGFGIAEGFGMLAISIAVLTVGEVIFEPAQQTTAAPKSAFALVTCYRIAARPSGPGRPSHRFRPAMNVSARLRSMAWM